jgi:hypothetical protein
MPDTNPQPLFEQMKSGQEPAPDPGYLQYLEVRAENAPEDVRVSKIVQGLTHVALRGEEGNAEYTDREPALQARYWYRSLGPLNPMKDVEPDLITAAEMMYGKEIASNSEESANLKMDSAYILAELARVTQNPETKRQALRLGLGVVQDIRNDESFEERPATYRLQSLILHHDLVHDALRLRHTGQLDPTATPDLETYREFEQRYAQQELGAITDFAKLVRDGITEENFGILFEWYFVMAERFDAWSNETIDTKQVRGATSRENAEWTGERDFNAARVTGNHDVVVNTAHRDGTLRTERYQLKAVKGRREYHPRVTVIDFQDAFQARFGSIDGATRQLMRNLAKFQKAYTELLV